MNEPSPHLYGYAHPIVDTTIVGGAVSAPWWLPLFNEWGQAFLILSGIILVVWRWVNYIRHLRSGKRRQARKDLGL